ncbi:DUF7546 family protein [Haloarchaeobius sp. TZWSO28]|uniref:DUF7546 family protein n=1 Tax=Haloarchaeobius sp. TZWSO28 TaxID=3446119 RepID=UPI003EB69963
MSSNTARSTLDALPSERVLWLGLLCALELLAVVAYFRFTSSELVSVRYALYPFVWINVGVLAVVATDPIPTARRFRLLGVAVAVGYFLLLAWFAGLISLAPAGHEHAASGFSVAMPSPGWGPTLSYTGAVFQFALVPFRVVGYLSLAYLVYATVLESLSASATGLVGLFSCVSCAFPLISSLASGTAGSAAALATVYAFGVDLSTLVFVVAVALLYWRPGVPSRGGA